MKRYFAFGCSYTNYTWLMVPDLIGVNFDQYYNFGLAGSCHTYMLNYLIQANELYKFNSDTDYITIGTTGFNRFSRVDVVDSTDSSHSKHVWVTNGDLFPINSDHPVKAQQWAKDFDSYQWAVYRSLTSLKTIILLLKLLGVKHKIYASIYNNHLLNLDCVSQTKETIDMIYQFNKFVDCNDSVDLLLTDYNSKKGMLGIPKHRWADGHPMPNNNYDYLKKYFPEYDTEKTRQIYNQQLELMDSASSASEYFEIFQDTFLRKYRTDYDRLNHIKHHPHYVKQI